MNVYLDSSVVLRRLQREPAPLAHWGQWKHAYSNVLLRVEVFRTVDRNRLRGAISDREASELITTAHAFFDAIEFVALSDGILNRASQSFFTALGTLDALHLATALRLVDAGSMELTFLTHDAELAIAARSVNFTVEGQ
jgi:predicted nucleic acid-binding protein